MIKYQDYFPKSMLYKCGIEPEAKLIGDEDLALLEHESPDKDVYRLINSMYSNIKEHFDKNHNPKEDFGDLNVDRKIVAMLCDLDIVKDVNKEKYLNYIKQNSEESSFSKEESRVSIELPELDATTINKEMEKSKRVATSSPQLVIKGKQE